MEPISIIIRNIHLDLLWQDSLAYYAYASKYFFLQVFSEYAEYIKNAQKKLSLPTMPEDLKG
jgi:hypothetical protein